MAIKITFDFMKDTQGIYYAKQNDTVRHFEFDLLYNGEELDEDLAEFIDGKTPRINAYRPYSNESYSYNAATSDDEIILQLDPWVTAKEGYVYLSLSYISNESILTTGKVTIHIHKAEYIEEEDDDLI